MQAMASVALSTGHQLPEALWQKLLPYQQTGVLFALRSGGRCLIGDEMGLGKTLQAICVALALQDSWPLLIVAPSSLRLLWAEELERWGAGILGPGDVHVVSDGRDAVIPLPKVTILSYGLVTQGSPIMTYISGQAAAAQVGSKKKDGKQQEQQQQQVQPQQQVQQRFGMVIVDESHYLKDSSTQRCKLLTPILHGAPHCVLLSGTPATNRPVDLFPQLHILSPAAFPSFFPFAERFCGAKRNRFGGWDFSGSTNQAELRGLLAPIMIRRLKADVLSQLPAKRRHRVVLTLCKEAAVQMEGQKKALEQQASNLDDALSGRGGGGGGGGGGAHDDNRSGRSEASSLRFDGLKLLGEFYNSTGAAKVAPVCTYLSELINGGAEKLIVFGHHLVVLDGIEQGLASQQVKLIRLDGSNSYDERHAAVARFQKDDTVQVALLSMTACGVGLTLTAASTVVFAELHWNPAVLLQAEDRAHRIGQTSSVNVHLCVAPGTADDVMWPCLDKKMFQLSNVLNAGKKSNLTTSLLSVGEDLKVNTQLSLSQHGFEQQQQQQQSPPVSSEEKDEEDGGDASSRVFSDFMERRSKGFNKKRKMGTRQCDVKRLFSQCEKQSGGGTSSAATRMTTCTIFSWTCGACTFYNSEERKVALPQAGSSSGSAKKKKASQLLVCSVCATPASAKVVANFTCPSCDSSFGNKARFECVQGRVDGVTGCGQDAVCVKCHQTITAGDDVAATPVSRGQEAADQFRSPGGGAASETTAGLQFVVSAATSFVHLFDHGGVSLGASFAALDLISRRSDALPAILNNNAPWLDLADVFLAEWQDLRAVDQQKLVSPPQLMTPPLQRYVLAASSGKKVCMTTASPAVLKFNRFAAAASPSPSAPVSAPAQATPAKNTGFCPHCSVTLTDAATAATLFEGFCSRHCRSEARAIACPGAAREQLRRLEKGVCQNCSLDCHALFVQLKPLDSHHRLNVLMGTRFKLAKRLDRFLSADLAEGDLWQGDHILPVAEGGGEATLEGYRTLCTPCHEAETQDLHRRLKQQKNASAAQGTGDIRGFFSKGK